MMIKVAMGRKYVKRFLFSKTRTSTISSILLHVHSECCSCWSAVGSDTFLCCVTPVLVRMFALNRRCRERTTSWNPSSALSLVCTVCYLKMVSISWCHWMNKFNNRCFSMRVVWVMICPTAQILEWRLWGCCQHLRSLTRRHQTTRSSQLQVLILVDWL